MRLLEWLRPRRPVPQAAPVKLPPEELAEARALLGTARQALFTLAERKLLLGIRAPHRAEDGHTTVLFAWSDVVHLLTQLEEGLDEGIGHGVEKLDQS